MGVFASIVLSNLLRMAACAVFWRDNRRYLRRIVLQVLFTEKGSFTIRFVARVTLNADRGMNASSPAMVNTRGFTSMTFDARGPCNDSGVFIGD